MRALESPKSKRMSTSAVKAAMSIILHHQQTFTMNETESESNEGDSDRNSQQDSDQSERSEAHRDTPESTSLECVAELFNPKIEAYGPRSKSLYGDIS